MLLLQVFLFIILHPLMSLKVVHCVPIEFPKILDVLLVMLEPQSVINGS